MSHLAEFTDRASGAGWPLPRYSAVMAMAGQPGSEWLPEELIEKGGSRPDSDAGGSTDPVSTDPVSDPTEKADGRPDPGDGAGTDPVSDRAEEADSRRDSDAGNGTDPDPDRESLERIHAHAERAKEALRGTATAAELRVEEWVSDGEDADSPLPVEEAEPEPEPEQALAEPQPEPEQAPAEPQSEPESEWLAPQAEPESEWLEPRAEPEPEPVEPDKGLTVGSSEPQPEPPLDLNSASFEQLCRAGLTVSQAARLIGQREQRGGFSSLDQLDELRGLPPDAIETLKRAAA
jgi:hypothetical protein